MRTVLAERLTGPRGWARRVEVPDHPNAVSNVATWLMHLPQQGVGYDMFMLAVYTLEARLDRPAPVLRYPEAEYELTVLALAPDYQPVPEDADTWMPMDPPNFSDQFHGITAVQAAHVAKACAQACTQGRLLAETQMYVELADGSPGRLMYIQQLVDMWSSAVRWSVEHERTGGLHSRVN